MKEPVFRLSRVSGFPAQDDELLADLRGVAGLLQGLTVTQAQYSKYGTYDCSTHVRRFGSWNQALLKAGLLLSNRVNISDEQLFENLFQLWRYYGRQPRRCELADDPSTISQSPYNRRFGSWIAALEAFVDYANSTEVDSLEIAANRTIELSRKTGRNPSLRLRWQVLQRDRFTCCGCGVSPARTSGIELQVDHKISWSKGGETIIENLQTLCSLCNLGKSNE